MAQWQAPTTNNERPPGDVGIAQQPRARPFLDAAGIVRWWSGVDALPAGATQLYLIARADGARVLSTDAAGEVRAALFGASYILIR